MNFDSIGGRRFSLSLWCVIQSGLLSYLKTIDSGTYGMVIAAVVAAYIAGNVTQKLKGNSNDPTN